jgi:hypothetical protein
MHIFLAMLTFLTLSTSIIWQIHSLVKKTSAHNKIINSLFIVSSMLILICYNNPIYYLDKLNMSGYLVSALNHHHDYAKYIFTTAIIGGFFLSLLALLPREKAGAKIVSKRTRGAQTAESGNYSPENIKAIALSMYLASWWFAGKLLYIGILLTFKT